MSSGHISFAESAKEALDSLRDANDMEGLLLRWRAARLMEQFATWAIVAPTPDEKQETVNELMSVMAGVNKRRVALKSKTGA